MATTEQRNAAAEAAATDRRLIIHPYLGDAKTERVIMTRGQGSRLWDIEGREYLDSTGGLWLAQIGHGRREVAEVAARQMEQLEYFMSFWEFSNDRAIELAERLVELAPAGIEQVYYTSGGTEGNEAAIKMARAYHHRRGEESRNWILARDKAYHGVGYGSGTATGFPVYHEGFGPMLPNVSHLTPPWAYRKELFDGQDPTDFLIAELEARIAELGAGNIAAMIGEPIMGVAGFVIPPDDYWTRVRAVLDRHGILLILDEVVSAYGRLGAWFAADHFGVRPDIIVTAKGLTSGYVPLGAVLVSGEVASTLRSGDGFPMGYTYNGHPTACAVALANLEIIEREGLLERATALGGSMLERLKPLEALPHVGEVRGAGMAIALELVVDKESREPLPQDEPVEDLMRREHGIIVRNCGHNVVLSPPLILTEDEADRIVTALGDVLGRLRPDGSAAKPA